jgi:AraC family transcriptional regulator, regulatory protein of adaptative response / methylated-DNA-[protein]-cysteine methyltransferase
MIAKTVYNADERRWYAIVQREQDADGSFFYGVKTTGVFCRPGCPSRLPNRENVEFFSNSREAQSAGYRPCMRCNPSSNSKNEEKEQIIIQACRSIVQSNGPLKLRDLAEGAGISPYHFHRLFKKIVGITPKQYASSHQADRFRECLKSSRSITDAIYCAGFSSSSGAYSKKRDHLAMKPGDYRAGGAGIIIHYGLAQCNFGWLIVAITDRGICAVEFGDDPAVLPQQVQSRFPKAHLEQAGSGFVDLIRDVVEFVNAPQESFNLPLDIRGTAFQQKVWSVLRHIKPGQTLSYTDVAENIGKPTAVRAVATACASNKLAVVIPCHRVISKDGTISSYRWGIERKKRLLESEKE